MATRPRPWILVVNQREARLLQAGAVPNGHIHIDIVGRIRNSWEEHQRGRPSPRAGKDGHTYASQGHEEETMMQRFARDVVDWLGQNVKRLDIDHLAIFAPPRFLGTLRKTWPPALAQRLEEHERDLGCLDNGDLVRHPEIVALVDAGAPT